MFNFLCSLLRGYGGVVGVRVGNPKNEWRLGLRYLLVMFDGCQQTAGLVLVLPSSGFGNGLPQMWILGQEMHVSVTGYKHSSSYVLSAMLSLHWKGVR